MASKRIRDLTERTTISSGDFLATDNSNGTRKVDASKIMTPISTAQSTADLVTDKVSGSGDAFSSTKGYSVGDLVIAPDDNLIYRCKTAYSTGASWNSRKTYFEQVTLVDAVSDLNSALNGYEMLYNEFATNTTPKSITNITNFKKLRISLINTSSQYFTVINSVELTTEHIVNGSSAWAMHYDGANLIGVQATFTNPTTITPSKTSATDGNWRMWVEGLTTN